MEVTEGRAARRRRKRSAQGRRGGRSRLLGRGRSRDPEPFEDAALCEPFPGATVLADLAAPVQADATRLVLARYAVIRILLLAAAGRLRGPRLRREQRVAAAHLATLPSSDWERHTLDRLAHACGERPDSATLDLARSCADSAAQRGHPMGAFALYRAVYEVALAREWWEEAACAAGGIQRLAELEQARRAERVWRWRTRVLQTRHLRRLERIATAGDDSISTADARPAGEAGPEVAPDASAAGTRTRRGPASGDPLPARPVLAVERG